ncbi:MAG TPA: PAS domain-containing protein [Candidatus Polarisedimenticolia bacterium]|nr:PAS domain-containing protein [Candidatus Polarisedimenticolia bacterium]
MILSEQLEADRAEIDRKRASCERSFNLAADACIITNLKFQIQNVNPAGLHLLGQPLAFLIRMPLLQFISMSDRHGVLRFVSALQKHSAHESGRIDITILPPRRESVLCSVTVSVMRNYPAAPARLRWLMRNVGAQKRFEAAMRHSQKIEALGNLVENLTNQFNNILAGIVINAGVARISNTARERRESLREIQAGCEKAAGLLKEFQKFTDDTAVHGALPFMADSARVSGG